MYGVSTPRGRPPPPPSLFPISGWFMRDPCVVRGGQLGFGGRPGSEKEVEAAAQRISGDLFRRGDVDRDGSISLPEFRSTIGPLLFSEVGGLRIRTAEASRRSRFEGSRPSAMRSRAV
jgi:hypothetical protein